MKVKQLRENLKSMKERIEKLENRLNEMPNMRPIVRRSNSGDWIITGVEIVDIRSKKYYKKMLNDKDEKKDDE